MKVTSIFPGSFYVASGDKAVLAGCPPEIVKVLLQKGLPSPTAILLPDQPVAQGESQVAVEFPLYHHLFFGGQKKSGGPLVLLGNHRRLQAARELLALTLLGPDANEMQDMGMDKAMAIVLARETRWFHIKDKRGRPVPIDDMVALKPLQDDKLDLGWLTIRRVSYNVFEFSADGDAETIDLTPAVPQAPPYPVTTDLTTTTLVKLGVEVLGGSTGFSPTQASSGLALCHNGNYILIDAIPYLNYHLRARGIARNQIYGIFLSHVHDDHCNVLSLLQYNRRIDVLSTSLVYRMMLRKLALVLDRPERELEEYFVFHELKPGKVKNYYGLRITAFWSSHSIPTIGAKFETTHAGKDYSVMFSGDTQALADVREMQKAGVISHARVAEIKSIYDTPVSLLLADAGEGQIHGDPNDTLTSPAERVVFMHIDKLPGQFAAHCMTASSGKRFPVVRGDTDYNLTRTIEFLLEYFPGMPPVWISNLLANQHVLEFNSGDIIIREGTQSTGYLYMILTGYAQVVQHDGHTRIPLVTMEAGELIGEMSIISGAGRRNASVIAYSPVIVTAIAENAFREYIEHQGLEKQLKAMWKNREQLQAFPYLRALQQPVIRKLSSALTREQVSGRDAPKPLQSMCERFGMIMPIYQELELQYRDASVVIKPHEKPVLCQGNETLLTRSPFEYLYLAPERSAKLRAEIPAFRFFWEEVMKLPRPD